VLATAGSLVFQGSTQGTLEAYSADTGKSLWTFDTGTSITAAPITYEVNGTQVLAVISGAGGASLLAGGTIAARQVPAHNIPRLLAFSLQGKAELPPAPPPDPNPRLPVRFGTPAQLARGGAVYDRYCSRCHGKDTINAGPLVDLKRSVRLANSMQWRNVVYAGVLGPTRMPGFFAELNPEDTEALRAYVVDRAHDPAASVITEESMDRRAKGKQASNVHRGVMSTIATALRSWLPH